MRGRIHMAVVGATLACFGCGGAPPDTVAVPDSDGALKSTAAARAERRAYDGAPPVIGHEDFGLECIDCHESGGIEVPDVGFSPPMPHLGTPGLSESSRCVQCHVFKLDDSLFAASTFEGLRQDLRAGDRLHGLAPPTIPHRVFMRENCAACHTGPAAREEIRTPHPERARCRQCHVEVTPGAGRFTSVADVGERGQGGDGS